MTDAELARDKLRCWQLMSRARKVGFPIPSHWLKYGEAPTNASEVVAICLDAVSDKLTKVFEQDSAFYKAMRRR